MNKQTKSHAKTHFDEFSKSAEILWVVRPKSVTSSLAPFPIAVPEIISAESNTTALSIRHVQLNSATIATNFQLEHWSCHVITTNGHFPF